VYAKQFDHVRWSFNLVTVFIWGLSII
jgi:hypothetical protein